jgi:hypothetical protein
MGNVINSGVRERNVINVKNPPSGLTPMTGDGSTNESALLTAIVNYAVANYYREVCFPSGIFMIRHVPLGSNLKYSGNGKDSIIMAHTSIQTYEGIFNIDTKKNIQIEGLVFDGQKGTIPGDDQSGICSMWITDSTNVYISKCVFQNNGWVNINADGSNYIHVEKSEFKNSDCGFITTNVPSTNISIIDNSFDGATLSEPIAIMGQVAGWHENIVIIGNTILNHTQGSGIALKACRKAIVTGNNIENCGSGIRTLAATYSEVVYGVENAVIANNTIKNSTYQALYINDLSNSIVCNNVMSDSAWDAITKSNCDDVQFLNNRDAYFDLLPHVELGGDWWSVTPPTCQDTFYLDATGQTTAVWTFDNIVLTKSDIGRVITIIFNYAHFKVQSGTYLTLKSSPYSPKLGESMSFMYDGTKFIEVSRAVEFDPIPARTIPTMTVSVDYGSVTPPAQDIFYVDAPAETSGVWRLGNILGTGSYIGRKIVVINKYVDMVIGYPETTTLDLVTSPWDRWGVGNAITLVFDGTLWIEVSRSDYRKTGIATDTLDGDYYAIAAPLQDSIMVSADAGVGSGRWHLQNITTDNAFIGKKLTVIFDAASFILDSTGNLVVDEWRDIKANDSITLIWNGTKWLEIGRSIYRYEGLPTISQTTDYQSIEPPWQNVFKLTHTDSVDRHLEAITGSLSYVGRVIDIIFITNKWLVANGTTLALRSSPWNNPAVGASLRLVWDGTAWQELGRTS